MFPKHVGGRYPIPGRLERAFSPLPLALYAHHLAQRVYDVHQIALCFHDGVDRLVRHRCFVDDVLVLAALDAGSRLRVIVQREAPLRLRTRHGSSGSMTTTHEALRITLAAHNERTRAHTPRDNSHVALTRAYRTLARDEHVVAVVVLPGHVVVMAAHDFQIGFEPGNLSRGLDRRDHVAHHQFAVGQGIVLRPVHG